MLHACEVIVPHPLPPQLGAGSVHDRVHVPPPQVAGHGDPHALHPPGVDPQATGSSAAPFVQLATPQDGAGLLQVLVRVLLHKVHAPKVLHALHTPGSTGQ